jgi:hypothetical protein
MSEEFIYYDDDGNLVYADSSELQSFGKKDSLSFDDFESFRTKLTGIEHDHYDELIFIDKLEKIITAHPFIDIRMFVEDYLSGLSSYKMIKKYQLNSRLEIYRIGTKYLGFSGKRVISQDNNLNVNLKNNVWKIKYDILLKCFSFFKNELNNLFKHNFLRGLIILYLSLESPDKFDNSEIKKFKNFCISHFDKMSLFHNDISIKNKFLDNSRNVSKKKIDLILNELKIKHIISSTDDIHYNILFPFQNLKKVFLDLLGNYNEGITHSNFNYKLIKNTPEFRFIPFDLIWNLILNPLESEDIIVRKHTQVWMGRPFNDMIFTKQNFDLMITSLRNQLEEFGQLKFFGRLISPDKFIDELIGLKRGNYDDSDDQVTRLAGLCLADSVLTTTASENLSDFDFSIDVSTYRFRPEQIESMKKSNFNLFCPILHCKVMINDVLDVSYLNHLYSLIPDGQQGVIFSFMPQNSEIKRLLKNDDKIQIIDEQGVRFWVEITPRIPSRVGSITQIQYDPINDHRGKTVRLDSVNYETGMSTVTILPELNQTNIHIRSLNEIDLHDVSNDDFISFSRNYFEFLKKLSVISNLEEYDTGLFEISPDEIIEHDCSWAIKFGEIISKIDLENNIDTKNYHCSCGTFSDDPEKLCRHLIASLNKLSLDEGFLKFVMTDGNFLYDGIMNFIANIAHNQIESLTDYSDYDFSSFFKKFLLHSITEKI